MCTIMIWGQILGSLAMAEYIINIESIVSNLMGWVGLGGGGVQKKKNWGRERGQRRGETVSEKVRGIENLQKTITYVELMKQVPPKKNLVGAIVS